MKRFAGILMIAAAMAAGPVLAKGGPKPDAFQGVGKGFGGFENGAKPGKGIPGGTIDGPRSTRAVFVLMTIFGSTTGSTTTQ